jgi:hypothetical protein
LPMKEVGVLICGTCRAFREGTTVRNRNRGL